ncbi:MAG: FHA domain-containing protein [Myxococcales bacterium]|nr:FHA domain-containing protein [Myxococcales bacterium]
MGNEDRRGGIGFGNQRRVDTGFRQAAPEDEVESTRAMDVEDFQPAATEFVRSPAPPPPPARAAPARPALGVAPRPPARPVPPEQEEEAATRMLEAMDYDPNDPAGGGDEPQAQLRIIELRVVQGPDRGKVHKIPAGTHLVGRGLDCQIVLADPAVSRKHFKIEREGEDAVMVDLGGANGTNVNGGRTARKTLETGDTIEIGTSVLEVHVEGQATRHRDRPKSAAHASEPPMKLVGKESEESGPGGAAKQGGPGMVIGMVALSVVVLIGGAVGAWVVFKGGDDPASKQGAAGGGAEAGESAVGGEEGEKLKKLIADAKSKLGDNDFSGALETLKAARKIDKANAQVKELTKTVQTEIDNQDAIDEAKAALKDGKFEAAMQRVADIDKASAVHADAQEVLNEAKDGLVNARRADAKKAMDSGDNAAALQALEAILKVDPQNANAKVMKQQLEGGGAAPSPGDKPAGDKGGPADKGVGGAKGVGGEKGVAAGLPAEPAVGAGPPKKVDFASALNAYHARKWSEAAQALQAISTGPFPKGDKAKATAYLTSVRQVEAAINEAGAAGTNARKATTSYKNAYNADKLIDGHHGAYLTGKIAEAYLLVAKTALAAKNYGDAVEAVREGMNYDEKPEMKTIEDKCIAQASVMLKEAKDHFAKKNYAMARDLAGQVVRIVSSMDPRAGEAQEIRKKATEAFSKDED